MVDWNLIMYVSLIQHIVSVYKSTTARGAAVVICCCISLSYDIDVVDDEFILFLIGVSSSCRCL